MHHMMNWSAAGRSGILIISSTKIMKGNQRLLFLMQVHINKLKACSVSCRIDGMRVSKKCFCVNLDNLMGTPEIRYMEKKVTIYGCT